MENVTLRELGIQKAEQAVVQTALAFYYHNPHCQYNREVAISADGEKMISRETTPEMACREMMHYEDCRGMVSDIYWNALHMIIPGTRIFWHPSVNNIGRDMQIMQYGHDDDGIAEIRDYETFVEELFRTIRPGDVLMVDKYNHNSHIMLYLGKCFGGDKRYVLHDWPVGGGTINLETGVNRYEPNGSATLQTVEDVWYPGNAKPNFRFGDASNIYVFRPLQVQAIQERVVPEATLSRLRYPNLCVTRSTDAKIYDTVLPGELMTVAVEVTNHSKTDYHGLSVVEFLSADFILQLETFRANGKKCGLEQVVDGRPAIRWTVDVPKGTSVKLTYQVKVRKQTAYPGKKITMLPGLVDRIPTREMCFRIGAGKMEKPEKDLLKKLTLKKAVLPESITPKRFRDLDYVNLFYKNVLSLKTDLPKTVQAYMDETMIVSRHLKQETWNAMVEMLEFRDRDELSENGKKLQDMCILRFAGGKYFHLEDRNDRAYDYLEEYFTPGDVFLVADGENRLGITDPDHLTVYIYLGNGMVIAHRRSGTTRESFADTVGTSIAKNIVLALRPTLI